ncbi:MAG: lysophospholipid acyltransferase family protein [Verrucomicrobiota bacterium]|nr:lysophospholipid acyltransferase family protein [Verrucomicrobiota bacterium]
MNALANVAARPTPRGVRLVALPAISPWRLKFFRHYARRHLARHFYSMRLLGDRPSADALSARVIFCNHASWWDPLVLLALAAEFFPNRESFAPIDAASLLRYGIFRRLGFFGITPGTRAGAIAFLNIARTILEKPNAMLWLTAQGHFADARVRPVELQRGLGHLGARLPATKFLPLALEYTFWEERLPEVLLHFGEPIMSDGSADALTLQFERALETAQDELAHASLRREPTEWHSLQRGRAGSSRIYDAWRRLRARCRGQNFSDSHSDK